MSEDGAIKAWTLTWSMLLCISLAPVGLGGCGGGNSSDEATDEGGGGGGGGGASGGGGSSGSTGDCIGKSENERCEIDYGDSSGIITGYCCTNSNGGLSCFEDPC
jgi:hypothetical protein